MKPVTYQELTEYIVLTLDVHPRFISTAINQPLKDIFDQDKKEVSAISENNVQKRLLNLYSAVQSYANLGLSSVAMTECLRIACFADHKNRMDSFVTANMQDKYNMDALLSIARLALTEYQTQLKHSDKLIHRLIKQLI